MICVSMYDIQVFWKMEELSLIVDYCALHIETYMLMKLASIIYHTHFKNSKRKRKVPEHS